MTPITDLLHKVEQDLTNIATATTIRDASEAKVEDAEAKVALLKNDLTANENTLTGTKQLAAADMRELASALLEQAADLDPLASTPVATPPTA